jgi:Zn-dependent protease with chaperone function
MTSATDPALASDLRPPAWQPLSAAEREDFFAAIARHRRAAWRVTFVCALTYALLTLVIALLLSPLLYAVLGLVLDVVNLVVPTPDLLGGLGRTINALVNAPGQPAATYLIQATALAAAPGLVLMGLAALVLRRALGRSALFNPARLTGRAVAPGDLGEQRFSNTVEEMAVAAAIPAPRVVVLPLGGNAAAFGPNEGHATVMVGEDLIKSLNREQMQGVAGHLIASVADGDMRIGVRTALVLGLFSLTGRVSGGFTDRAAFLSTRRLLRALLAPTPSNLDFVLSELSDPFAADAKDETAGHREPGDQTAADPGQNQSARAATAAGEPTGNGSQRHSRRGEGPTDRLTWKEWAVMPLMGPVVISGFLGGFVSSLMLKPLIALAWRQRKYMADATAVRLTRDPDALAGALNVLARFRGARETASWAGHLSVIDPGSREDAGLLGESFVSIFPSPERRIEALVKLGADARSLSRRRSRLPLPVLVVLAGLGVIMAALLGTAVVLLVEVSAALSGLFTLVPAALLHHILR